MSEYKALRELQTSAYAHIDGQASIVIPIKKARPYITALLNVIEGQGGSSSTGGQVNCHLVYWDRNSRSSISIFML